MTGCLGRGDLLGRDVFDVGSPGAEGSDFRIIDIKPDDVITGAGISENERQTNVAEADDTDDGGLVVYFLNWHWGKR